MNKILIAGAFAAVTSAAVIAAPGAHADQVCGYAPSKIVALGPTTCPFAMNVAHAFMNGGGNNFSAYSPETGESYQMHCMIEQHGSVTCRGGNGAAVQIF